ncbi:hypothetical protein HN832_00360 [archaeon]|jgi:hypothetical protein|nr:hypothetical protein [archaeon]MBT4373696.1 hypothetical protein [archaeon]MBT4531750.1 hypothetical protein [archaeon]MBT7001862.1 hypothetical protein [archaeon]MBT7281847.1 hypothetical protein [archaeon]
MDEEREVFYGKEGMCSGYFVLRDTPRGENVVRVETFFSGGFLGQRAETSETDFFNVLTLPYGIYSDLAVSFARNLRESLRDTDYGAIITMKKIGSNEVLVNFPKRIKLTRI